MKSKQRKWKINGTMKIKTNLDKLKENKWNEKRKSYQLKKKEKMWPSCAKLRLSPSAGLYPALCVFGIVCRCLNKATCTCSSLCVRNCWRNLIECSKLIIERDLILHNNQYIEENQTKHAGAELFQTHSNLGLA